MAPYAVCGTFVTILFIIRKSVIGSNIHIEVNEFDSLWIVFCNDSQRFRFSPPMCVHHVVQ